MFREQKPLAEYSDQNKERLCVMYLLQTFHALVCDGVKEVDVERDAISRPPGGYYIVIDQYG